MKTTLILATLILSAWSFQTEASLLEGKKVLCHIPSKEQYIYFSDTQMSFINSMDIVAGKRAIASLEETPSRREGNGFSKFMKLQGKQYKVHIASLKKFSDNDDYLRIMNKKGHKMSYPLNCQYYK